MIETSGNIETIDSKTPGSDIIHWQYSLDTIAIGTLDARSMEWTGNSEMLVVRLHPEYWTFESRYYRSLPAEQRLSALEWLQQTKSSIVINAGQYGTDFRHLGWFVHQSRNLGTRQHPIWKGLFTGDPKPGSGLPLLQIHDLQETPLTLDRLPFREAAQSLMLFDTRGTIRVNRSNRHARRC
ncbi:MAG TPA: hypothetical protein PLV45_19395, partial [bacterium]|nr:hypothetical protein [bacterium]